MTYFRLTLRRSYLRCTLKWQHVDIVTCLCSAGTVLPSTCSQAHMTIHTMYVNRLVNINEEICENRLDVDRHSMSDMHMQIFYKIRMLLRLN